MELQRIQYEEKNRDRDDNLIEIFEEPLKLEELCDSIKADWSNKTAPDDTCIPIEKEENPTGQHWSNYFNWWQLLQELHWEYSEGPLYEPTKHWSVSFSEIGEIIKTEEGALKKEIAQSERPNEEQHKQTELQKCIAEQITKTGGERAWWVGEPELPMWFAGPNDIESAGNLTRLQTYYGGYEAELGLLAKHNSYTGRFVKQFMEANGLNEIKPRICSKPIDTHYKELAEMLKADNEAEDAVT